MPTTDTFDVRAVLTSWSLDRIVSNGLAVKRAPHWVQSLERALAEHGYTICREDDVRAEERARIADAIEAHCTASALSGQDYTAGVFDAARIARGDTP